MKNQEDKFKASDTKTHDDIVLSPVKKNEQRLVKVSDDIIINLAKAFTKYPRDVTIWIARYCSEMNLPIEQAKRVIGTLVETTSVDINKEELMGLCESAYIISLWESHAKPLEEILKEVGFKDPRPTIENIREQLRYVILGTHLGHIRIPLDARKPEEIVDLVFTEELLDKIIAYLKSEGIIEHKDSILPIDKLVSKYKRKIVYELVRLSGEIFYWVAVQGDPKPNEITVYLYFRGRLYEGKPYVYRFLSNVLKDYVTTQIVNNALLMLMAKDFSIIARYKELNPIHKFLIPFKNGVLDVKNMEFIPWPEKPNRGLLFTKFIEWNVDPDFVNYIKKLNKEELEDYIPKIAPKFDNFLNRLFGERKKAIWEALGTILYPFYVRKMFLIIGPPGIGKSALLTIIERIFGELCSHYTLDFIVNTRWQGYLIGHLVNVNSEEPRNFLRIDEVKRITGESTLFGDVKYKPPAKGPNIITLIFALNEPPKFETIDNPGFLERLYIILANDSEEAKIDRPDREFALKLVENEGNKILHYIIACYEWLRKKDYIYEYDIDEEEKYNLLLKRLSNVYEWAEQELEINPYRYRGMKKGTELYEAYLRWCSEMKEEPVGRNTFYNILIGLGALRVRKGNQIYFKGVRLRSEELSQQELTSPLMES
mgnify:CR=1 FL=1